MVGMMIQGFIALYLPISGGGMPRTSAWHHRYCQRRLSFAQYNNEMFFSCFYCLYLYLIGLIIFFL